MKTKKILFITGTRADYGKIKTLIQSVEAAAGLEAFVYVSGMHLIALYGNTYKEVLKDHYKNIYVAFGQQYTNNMSRNLGNVLMNMSSYAESIHPDMIVVHGDRTDALAGAIVGALNNIIVAHIEGGEITGTIDDSIRHAITKFAHLHMVSNKEAAARLVQLGEDEKNIYVIGSPDIDVMKSDRLPRIEFVKDYYEIPFQRYAVFAFHPVTTEQDTIGRQIREIADTLEETGKDYVVIYPNNDLGTEIILDEIKKWKGNDHFRIYPSIRFEYFLTLLKHSDFIAGNSSAGIRESGIYGIPAIDIGTRQNGRYHIEILKNIQHVEPKRNEILQAIKRIDEYRIKNDVFGNGNSTGQFMEIIQNKEIWNLPLQKIFVDYNDL